MMMLVVLSPHSSSCVLLGSKMFFAAGCAMSASRGIALPSFVILDRIRENMNEIARHARNASCRIEHHLQHCLRAQTCPDLTTLSQLDPREIEKRYVLL